MSSEQLYGKEPIGKLILKTSVPCMVIMLVNVVYNLADTFFIGRTGDAFQVAAVSLAAPIMSMLSAFGTMIGFGGCSAIATALGKNQRDLAGKMSSFCCYSSLAVGVLFFVILYAFRQPILGFMGTSPNTESYAWTYLVWISAGAPLTMLASSLSNIIRAQGQVGKSMAGNLVGSIVNIGLDPVLISGLDMGVAGAAIATVVGNCVACIYYLAYCLRISGCLSLRLKDFTLARQVSLKILSLGLPSAAGILLMSVSQVLKNNLVSGYGDIPVAAMGIAGRIVTIVGMMQMAVTTGIQPAMAFNYGAGNTARMSGLVKRSGQTVVVIGALLAAVVVVFRAGLVNFFIDDVEILAYGTVMIAASVISGPVTGLCHLSTGFLQAIDKPSYAMIISILRQGIIFTPLLYLLNAIAGLNGLIYSQAVADILSAVIAVLLLYNQYKKMVGRQQSS